ncbi:hypothetical protein GQ53DRAFT_756227 [Thozetella sp. PMI_491]|nr:hypothetical protein GQ53DRAFT_756227 [Thozetella sp. PMI_491]
MRRDARSRRNPASRPRKYTRNVSATRQHTHQGTVSHTVLVSASPDGAAAQIHTHIKKLTFLEGPFDSLWPFRDREQGSPGYLSPQLLRPFFFLFGALPTARTDCRARRHERQAREKKKKIPPSQDPPPPSHRADEKSTHGNSAGGAGACVSVFSVCPHPSPGSTTLLAATLRRTGPLPTHPSSR